MSGRIKIILLATGLLFIAGCSFRVVPKAYRFTPEKIDRSATGNWISVTVNSDPSTGIFKDHSGELIAFQGDTIYILDSEGLKGIRKKDVIKGTIFVFAPPKYPFVGFASLILNVIGAFADSENALNFLAMGIPIAVISTVALIGERLGSSTIKYPGNFSSEELVRYSRFPQGIPPGLDRNSLHLK